MLNFEIDLKSIIKKNFINFGFSSCGISNIIDTFEQVPFLEDWINKGFHAEMNWLKQQIEIRKDIKLLFPDTKSVIVLTMNYYSGDNNFNSNYIVSKYALNNDYHNVLKKRMAEFSIFLQTIDSSITTNHYCDSAPIFEKEYAVNSGLGWIGKNSCLIQPKMGSYYFIGIMLINKQLESDTKFEKNYCGKCTKCIDACPTKAIVEPGVIDSNRCLSYITIEHKGDIENEYLKNSHYIFGCDICQDVCPINKFKKPTCVEEFYPSEFIKNATDEEWQNLNNNEFKKIFVSSPIKRAGLQKIKRNIKELGVSSDEESDFGGLFLRKG